VAVEGLFARFPRLVRSLAAQLQKRVEIHLGGEDVEIDKSLLEELDAPLTHMIRNVVDHGLEPPAERRARGASDAGNLWLSAEESATDITIIVRDDGRGIDPLRVRRLACERGMLTSDRAAAMSDAEAVELIFEPGFSTAERISEVSGRGVGLDVVRSVVRDRGGDVQVTSQVGAGTTFRLVLPR
jgi:two-component system chemotaxis sensor kinase CheA